MAYALAVPGSVAPHGYSRCSFPPAAAYSHSAALGKKPRSQIQNAYASYQFTQSIGRFSCVPAMGVQVLNGGPGQNDPPTPARLVSVGVMWTSSGATHPGS